MLAMKFQNLDPEGTLEMLSAVSCCKSLSLLEPPTVASKNQRSYNWANGRLEAYSSCTPLTRLLSSPHSAQIRGMGKPLCPTKVVLELTEEPVKSLL